MNLDAIMIWHDYDYEWTYVWNVKYKSRLGQVKNVMPMTFLGFPNRPA
jgi:hypothetical protein